MGMKLVNLTSLTSIAGGAAVIHVNENSTRLATAGNNWLQHEHIQLPNMSGHGTHTVPLRELLPTNNSAGMWSAPQQANHSNSMPTLEVCTVESRAITYRTMYVNCLSNMSLVCHVRCSISPRPEHLLHSPMPWDPMGSKIPPWCFSWDPMGSQI